MRTALFSAALLASSAAFTAVPINGWYSSIFGGYTYMPDNLNISRFGVARTDANYHAGYNAGARVGFQSYPLRYEAEFTYIDNNIKRFNINGVRQLGPDGQATAALGMANAYFDFPDMVPSVSPFLGVGVGYAWVEGIYNARGPFLATRYRGDGSALAYQATAGFTYNFSENYAANIAYRYVGTTKVDQLGKLFQANLATAGVIYRFDEATYK